MDMYFIILVVIVNTQALEIASPDGKSIITKTYSLFILKGEPPTPFVIITKILLQQD